MHYVSVVKRLGLGLVVAALLSFTFAQAQTEPTMDQIYVAAKAGKLADAQEMIGRVLVSHPKSAKAHYVQSELFARQGKWVQSREALAEAEKLAPGLPFAKPEAVSALRTQLMVGSAAVASQEPAQKQRNVAPSAVSPGVSPAVAPASPSSSWGLPLLLAGGVIVAGYFIFRRKPPVVQQPAYAGGYASPGGGLSGPQTFGAGTAPQPYGAPPYGGQPYGAQPYGGQPAGSGLGGKIMGGVATGLAVGAGVMAAEAIGRSMMGNHNDSGGNGALGNHSTNDFQPVETNRDMGGQDFGINDAGSWDDGGSSDVAGGGGGDWDS